VIPFRVYSDKTVLQAAKDRIAWLFDEFPHVITTTSGGKDSVCNFHLALEVARKKNRLPLNVMFLDQEIEWEASIAVIRAKMEHPEVKPFWMQIPFQLSNSTSASEEWLYCWDPKKKDLWMRPQESYSYKENVYGKVRFNELLTEIPRFLFNGEPVAILGGVRCEESPARTLGLTSKALWKWATWGQGSRAQYGVRTFYPLYDWHTSDVWKAIHDHKWKYNCNTGDALIWMGDYTFKRIDQVKAGDVVIGWTHGKTHRQDSLIKTTVEAVGQRKSAVVKIRLESGRVLRCTLDHRWLCRKRGHVGQGQWEYRPVVVGDTVAFVVDPCDPEEPITQWGAWLGGVWDSEGHRSVIVQSRKQNPEVCERIEDALKFLGVHYGVREYDHQNPGMLQFRLVGGPGGRENSRSNLVRFVNKTKPVKAGRLDGVILGNRFRRPDRVVSIEADGEALVYGLQTGTRNYVARGYASSNSIYDAYYQYGFGIKEMRISNFHHETSVQNMFVVQEVEPHTYSKAVARLAGLDSAAKFGFHDYFPKELPYMFASWKEYRDYLLEKLIAREDWRKIMARRFARDDRDLFPFLGDKLHRMHVASVCVNDWEGVKCGNLRAEAKTRKMEYERRKADAAKSSSAS